RALRAYADVERSRRARVARLCRIRGARPAAPISPLSGPCLHAARLPGAARAVRAARPFHERPLPDPGNGIATSDRDDRGEPDPHPERVCHHAPFTSTPPG